MIIYRIAWILLKPFAHIIFLMRAKGLKNVPKKGPVIIAAKHSAAADPIFHALTLRRTMRSMAKVELFQGWFMNWVMHQAGAFPVKRGKSDKGAIELAVELLENGEMVLIFPEGTRSRSGTGTFKTGAVMLASMTGAPIVPATIVTKRGYTPFCNMKVIYGEPVTAEELGVKGSNSNALRQASEKLRELVMELADAELTGKERAKDEPAQEEQAG